MKFLFLFHRQQQRRINSEIKANYFTLRSPPSYGQQLCIRRTERKSEKKEEQKQKRKKKKEEREGKKAREEENKVLTISAQSQIASTQANGTCRFLFSFFFLNGAKNNLVKIKKGYK